MNFLAKLLSFFSLSCLVESLLTTPTEELCQHVYDSCPSLRSHLNPPQPFLPEDDDVHVEVFASPTVLIEIDDYNQRFSVTSKFTVRWILENSSAWFHDGLSNQTKKIEFCDFSIGDMWIPQLLLLNNVDNDKDPMKQ